MERKSFDQSPLTKLKCPEKPEDTSNSHLSHYARGNQSKVTTIADDSSRPKRLGRSNKYSFSEPIKDHSK